MRPVSSLASASWTAGKVSSTRQWVTAGRPAGTTAMRLRSRDGGPQGRRPCPRRPGGGLDQGQVAALDPVVGQLAGQGQVGGVVLGHQQQPGGALVEPVDDAGSARSPPADRLLPCRPGALTRVPVGWPGPGWTTRPAGLATTSSRSSSWRTASGGRSSGTGSPVGGAGGAQASRSPSRTRYDLRRGRPSTVTRSSVAQRAAWDREVPASSATTSSRRRAASGPATASPPPAGRVKSGRCRPGPAAARSRPGRGRPGGCRRPRRRSRPR